MITIEELTWAYRIFLAREPEDAHISANSRSLDKNLPGIRKEFMTSFEYASPICQQKRQCIGVTPEFINWAYRLVLLKEVPEKLTQSWPNLDALILYLAEEYRATNRSIPSILSLNSKIVILGNCQSAPLEKLLRHRGNFKYIKSYLERSLNKETLSDVDLREIESADLIISQPLLSKSFGPLETKKLTGSRKNVLIIPNLYFTGMHPELVYVGSSKNRLKSQLDEYHSAIAIAAFFAGLSVKETASLYRSREFFEDCGLFDEWQESLREYLLREYVCDISLFKYLQGKTKRDPMFYTVNHPALPLLAHLASAILELFDIQPNWQTDICDEFKSLVIYPVWTPLVESHGLGFQNNDNFYVENKPISLEKYLRRTFKDYRKRTPLGVRSPEKLARIEKSIKKGLYIKQNEAIIERIKKGLLRLIVKTKPAGYVTDNTDCANYDSSVHPGATEIPGDVIDQDCNGNDLPSTDSVESTCYQQSIEWVQKAYVSYYGRPGDVGGVEYWAGRLDAAGGSLDSIIDAFGTSQEFTEQYGSLSSGELIDTIYQQMFNRAPDAGGRAYYTDKLTTGAITLQSITLNVLGGALDNDLNIINNKLELAAYFTNQLELHDLDYIGVAASKELLGGVGGVASDLARAKDESDVLISDW